MPQLPSQITFGCESGWFQDAEIIRSPNFDERPPGCAIDLLVIHAISLPPGEFGGGKIDELFLNRLDPSAHPYFHSIDGLRVSSHFLIERAGLLKQFVSTAFRAWHCGLSSFDGRSACNDFAIGIELEGCDEAPFTPHQYSILGQLLAQLMGRHPLITSDRIVGHSDIAPERKTDPGPKFDWAGVRSDLALRVESGRVNNP